MNNQLMKYEDMRSMSQVFFDSKMFKDATSAAIALVKIQAGQEIGIAPFAAMTGIYIIQGRPTLGAGIIAGRIKASGKYDFRVKRIDDQACIIDFFEGGQVIGTSSFTIEDAKKAGTQNIGKFPRNMLYARAISNGQKWFAPDVFDGPVYTPEDFGQTTEDVQAGNMEIIQPEPVALPILTTSHPSFDKVVDAIVNKGYTLAQYETKFTITKEVADIINDALSNKPATVSEFKQVTQADIHEMNQPKTDTVEDLLNKNPF